MYNSVKQTLSTAFLGPIFALKKEYVPLLLIYFAYGFQSVTAVTITFWEKDSLALSASELLSLSVWVSMPWTLKLIFGQLVDHFPLFGSRRKSYVVVGAVLMTIGYMVLMGLMAKADWALAIGSTYAVYLLASLLTTFGFLIQDVTADTLSTEVVPRTEIKRGKTVQRPDKDVQKEVALVQILGRLSLMLAGVVAAFLTGRLADAFKENPENIVWVAFVIPIISLLGVLALKTEAPASSKHSFDRVVLGGGFVYAIFMLVMAFIGPLTEMVSSGVFVPVFEFVAKYAQEVTFIVSFALLSSLLWRVLQKESRVTAKNILLVLGAIFVFRAMPSTGPGFSWWAIDVLGFDQKFFGVIRLVGSIVPLLLLWMIADFIASKPVKSVLLFLVVVGGLFSLPELSLYYGIYDLLGISPRAVAIADTVLDSPLMHISMIPMLAMIAYYAPAHSRATWFALAASFMNLALTAAALGTKYLNQIFVVSREVVGENGEILVAQDYSQLGILMIVKILIVFIIPFVGILILIPNNKSVQQ